MFFFKDPFGVTRICPGESICLSFLACLFPPCQGLTKLKECHTDPPSLYNLYKMRVMDVFFLQSNSIKIFFPSYIILVVIDKENFRTNNLMAQCQKPDSQLQ